MYQVIYGTLSVGRTFTASSTVSIDAGNCYCKGYRCWHYSISIWGNYFNFYWNGNFGFFVDTSWIEYIQLQSDDRKKKNVKTLDVDALDMIMRLRPIKYRNKNIDVFVDD